MWVPPSSCVLKEMVPSLHLAENLILAVPVRYVPRTPWILSISWDLKVFSLKGCDQLKKSTSYKYSVNKNSYYVTIWYALPLWCLFLLINPARPLVRENVFSLRNYFMLMPFQARTSLGSYSIHTRCLCIENISIDSVGH